MSAEQQYIVKWNGCAYAVHDAVADWNVEVFTTERAAQERCAVLNKQARP